MALSAKREGVKQVPWFSLTEWHQVYKQVYSNDTAEQTKAYETLLAWKARIPKLPIGVDCTLSIIQVCLRDREWTPKIDNGELSISYENDLCLMYSTTIMRFLNHISNIGHTKQTSLFQIAKQLQIPEWIVNLRHDAAHGHELPSIGVLRIAINILLIWLHEEYWGAEARSIEECLTNDNQEAQETEEVQAFSDLIELWTAVSLYIHAGYCLVSDIPDAQLQESLQDLRSFAIKLSQQKNGNIEKNQDQYEEAANDDIKKDKKYCLATARIVLLSEISRYLGKKSIPKKENIVFDALFDTEVFVKNPDVLSIFTQHGETENEFKDCVLPLDMLIFWKDIIFLLHNKDMMETLILKLLKLVDDEDENKNKRLLASLWISSICYSYTKLDIAQCISRDLEYQLDMTQKKLSQKAFELKVKEETEQVHPHLKQVLWFDLSDIVPNFLIDMKFISRLLLNANEFYAKFIPPIVELARPKMDKENKQLLLNFVDIYTLGKMKNDNPISDEISTKTFTIADIHKQCGTNEFNLTSEKCKAKKATPRFLSDRTVRKTDWKLSLGNYQWSSCPVGVLPWQIDSLEMLNPLKTTLANNNTILALESEITPGIIDNKELKMRSQINWDNVLRKKKRLKRRYEGKNADIIVNRALETAKKQK